MYTIRSKAEYLAYDVEDDTLMDIIGIAHAIKANLDQDEYNDNIVNSAVTKLAFDYVGITIPVKNLVVATQGLNERSTQDVNLMRDAVNDIASLANFDPDDTDILKNISNKGACSEVLQESRRLVDKFDDLSDYDFNHVCAWIFYVASTNVGCVDCTDDKEAVADLFDLSDEHLDDTIVHA